MHCVFETIFLIESFSKIFKPNNLEIPFLFFCSFALHGDEWNKDETKGHHMGSAFRTVFAWHKLLCLEVVQCPLQAGGGVEGRSESCFRGSVVDGSE